MALTPPATTYLDAMNEEIRRRQAAAASSLIDAHPAPDYPDQGRLWDAAGAAADALRPQLAALAFDLHDHPEEAFEEVHAAAALVAFLAAEGVPADEIHTGVGGLETALSSEWTSPGFREGVDPTVAILAEYDALPEIGHACGHNVIAAAGVGAYLAARRAAAEAHSGRGLRGRIRLIGTPAEEGHSGKEYLIRGGAFEGVDAAVMIHPFGFDLAEHVWVGRRTLTATFRGVAAHASSQPFMGRNALDAATLAYQGFGLLRQQMPPSDRLHAIITSGGQRPSVIPDRAELAIYVRSLLPEALAELSDRVQDILDGAALMAGVDVEVHWDTHPASLPVRNNHALSRRWAATQASRGRDALPGGVVPDTLAASTDFGNVSHLMPGIHPMIKISPEHVALHTREFSRYARSEQAVDAAVDAAAGLAQVALDLLADPALLASAREEFAAAGGAKLVGDYLPHLA